MRDRGFFLDVGWLYVAAGLALCAAGVLVPAQRDLDLQRRQLARLDAEVRAARSRLDAYGDFVERLDRRDPPLVRRLAASQLNVLAGGGTAMLVSSSRLDPVEAWIAESVEVEAPSTAAPPRTLLVRMTEGRLRLWLIAAGIVAIFAGLLMDGRPAMRPRRRVPLPRWAPPVLETA